MRQLGCLGERMPSPGEIAAALRVVARGSEGADVARLDREKIVPGCQCLAEAALPFGGHGARLELGPLWQK